MKTVNRICQILSIILALVSVVLFFTDFAVAKTAAGDVTLVGTELAFGSKIDVAGQVQDMARSSQILFCFLLTTLGLVLSVFSYKSKKVRYATPVVGLGAGIYTLVMALGNAAKFVDARPLNKLGFVLTTKADGTFDPFSYVSTTKTALFAAIALLAFAVMSVVYLLVDDYIEVVESKGAKRTIFARVIAFFKDYKSEIKKIVWPGGREVAKNTSIVIVICLIIGAFIWLLDWGLVKLIELIF